MHAHAQKPCTIVFPWYMGKYKYKSLTISSSKIWNMLRQPSYLDDLLILTNNCFKDHLLNLEIVPSKLSMTGMRVNISKSKFIADQIEFMGYWISRQGIQPKCNKVEAFLNIMAPKIR
jgi:hypothetical protein